MNPPHPVVPSADQTPDAMFAFFALLASLLGRGHDCCCPNCDGDCCCK